MLNTRLKLDDGRLIDLTQGYEHYLALALLEEYSLPIILLMHNDTMGKEILEKCLNVIGLQYTYNSLDGFRNLNVNTHPDILQDKVEIKRKLNKLGINYTDKYIKKAVREMLRNYWISVKVNINNVIYDIVYWCVDKNTLYYFVLNDKKEISKMLRKIPMLEFQKLEKYNLSFIPRENYKGLTKNEITRKI